MSVLLMSAAGLACEGDRGPSGPLLDSDVVDFLRDSAVPLTSTDPAVGHTDLEPLRDMIGDARIVALGEGTHGTREFFELKHRMVRFLVQEAGFTHFAIEASWPEANDVNHYVLTGEGDPRALLSSLYFWTWNTREILDLIEWMRKWNSEVSADRQIQFAGFDIQFPGAAMDTVAAFLGRVDQDGTELVGNWYDCLRPYRNTGRPPVRERSIVEYAYLPVSDRQACRAGLQEAFDYIADRRDPFESATSKAAYENVLQSARLVLQFERMAASANTNEGFYARDAAMADNTDWLLQQARPGSRIIVWAHNGHVSRRNRMQGAHLSRLYGSDYLALGFLFGSGAFNAVGAGGLGVRYASYIPDYSMEAVFVGTNSRLSLFDTRGTPASDHPATVLRGPIWMRSIGAAFDAATEPRYYLSHHFPADLDLLLFVAETTPTTLLPFVWDVL